MSDRELSDIDELVEIDDRTNPDGTVDVTIEGWERISGGSVRVEFGLVTDTTTEKMDWPQFGDDMEDYKFHRLVTQSGLSMRNADLLEGEEAKAVRHDKSGWSLVAEEELTFGERVREILASLWAAVSGIPFRKVIITLFWMVSVSVLVTSAISLL